MPTAEGRAMREWNALRSYPQPESRVVGERTIRDRILASYRGRDFFDGPRSSGYGGLKDDGRWEKVAYDLREDYALEKGSRVIQLGSEKGFLLSMLKMMEIEVVGVEASSYARRHSKVPVLPNYPPESPPFDLCLALGVVYTLNLGDAMNLIRSIERVAHKSFITLGAYDTEEDLRLFRKWTLLGTTILKQDEWREVLNHCGFTGDYWFVTAESLKLRE